MILIALEDSCLIALLLLRSVREAGLLAGVAKALVILVEAFVVALYYSLGWESRSSILEDIFLKFN